jgi:hypothetical protein
VHAAVQNCNVSGIISLDMGRAEADSPGELVLGIIVPSEREYYWDIVSRSEAVICLVFGDE